ncbi:MAG: PAS domain S-box protein [Verrucomicrobiales bacterium]
MKIPLPPLRYSIPGILLLVGLMLGVISTVCEIRLTFARLEEVMERHVRFIGSQTSGLASFLMGQGDIDGLNEQVSQLGADQTLQVALILDESGMVVQSSRFELSNKNISETPWAYAAAYITNLNVSDIHVVQNRSKMIGVFPFNLPVDRNELISNGAGLVFLEYDLAGPKKLTLEYVKKKTTFVLAALAFFCVLAWWLFHKAITQRIDKLVQATRDLAAGNLEKRAALDGSDELAMLSQSFDQMAAEISRRTVDLRGANEQMKREIEDRKTAEKALRRSEILFRSVWENSSNGMRLTDAKGLIKAANPSYCELVGFTETELLNQPFIRSFAASSEVDQLFNRYIEKFHLRSIDSGAEKKVVFRSGRIAHLAISNSYIQVPSGELFLLSILRDVTDKVIAFDQLKRAKEFSENLIATANVLIIGITQSGSIQIFNETAEKLSGFSRGEVKGKNLFHTLIPTSRFPDATERFAFPPDDHTMHSFEHTLITRNGEERIVSWQINALNDESEWSGAICFGIDITDRKKQEEERLEFERKLLDTQKLESLGLMAGGIAHDFNNLLTAILGNASLAAMHVSEHEEQVKGHLDNVEKACLRAAELCKQMLAYSGRGRLVTEHVNLNGLIKELTGLLDITISKKVNLRLSLCDSIPMVEGDKSQFHQVIMNLIINASEAIGDERGRIDVQTGSMHASREFLAETYLSPDLNPAEYVFIKVADSGCGMTAETKAKIFDPFFTTKFTGRGLGLAAVLGIVRGHKGALKVESEPGRGTTFTLLLPAATTLDMVVAERALELPMQSSGKGMILVADDEDHIVQVVRKALAKYGFETMQANDGRTAIDLFVENQMDIVAVLLDLTMPVMNGAEAFEEIKAIAPSMPVILMSGYSEQEMHERFHSRKPDGFLQKPFNISAVAASVLQILTPREEATEKRGYEVVQP